MTLMIDPVTLEVIKNGLASVADEMALVVMRSAYSPVVRDTMDYSTALCDRDGELVAQGLTLAVQLGTFPTIMRHVREHFGDDVQPGDVFLANDPYGFGGQHLPDLYVIQPIFHDGELEGYAATMAHHVDVGGLTPGSIAVHATEIYQEGLRLPLLKLYEAGRENTTVIRIIEKNTRQPIEVIGDLRAQIAACRAGERGLIEILERYGTLETRRYMDELQLLSERLMRAELAALPDGVYAFEDFIDGFGDEPEPLRIAVELTVRGDEVWVDLEGTAPQVAAGLNCPVGMVNAGVYCAFRGIAGREIPNAGGYMRPIHINAPVGTIVNPVLPAACGARGVVGYRVYDAVMGALAQVVPEKVIAPGEGGPTLIAIGGYQDGKPVRPHRGARRLLGRAGGPRRPRGRVEPARQPVEPAGRDGRERPAAAGARLRARRRLGRPGALPRRSRLRALVRAAGRRGGADRALRPARPPALRDRGRGGGSAVVEHDRRRRRSRRPDDADGGAAAAPGRRLPPRLGGRRRQRLAVRARSGARARGRARREGERRGCAGALRRRRSRTARRPAP